MKSLHTVVSAVFLIALAAGCADEASPNGGSSTDADVSTSSDGSDISTPDTVEDAEPTPDAVEDTEPTPDAVEDTEPTPDAVEDTQPVQDVESDGVQLPTDPPPVIASHDTFIGDWAMNPGQEVTKCVVKRLGNEDVAWISAIHTTLNAGSHHMIIYKSDETEEKTEPFNCTPFVETLKGETYPLMITQIPEETLAFPPGVAFKFEPNQMVRIEAHYLNYYPEEITAHADITFDSIAASDVAAEANMLFYGTPDIDIPANSTYTTPWFYLDTWPGTEVFAVTGHTHQYGTNVEISLSTSKSDEGTPIYPGTETYLWDEPPVTYFDPPLQFDGSNGFRYRCSWDNTSNQSVGFGESANQEMCFFWAYYYPSNGYRICVSPGGLGGGVAPEQICCPDDGFLCDLAKQWL